MQRCVCSVRWKQCANIVNDGLGLAVGSLYIKSPYNEVVEHKVRATIYSKSLLLE